MKLALRQSQGGMALFVSLIFLLLLSIIGVASMKSATLQEKMAGNVKLKIESFQRAEKGLREGESFIATPGKEGALGTCAECVGAACRVPDFSSPSPGVGACDAWKYSSASASYYYIQKLGTSSAVMNLPEGTNATLYRVTAVASAGGSKTALESIYAHH